ncbi:MAG: baseplate J/gp47 family protein [Dehalococcoidia bacterium]
MSLPPPNLDDRTFDQLLEEAKIRIQQMAPDWTDLSPGNPGMVLLELFAHLTEVMIYRLNRVPEKAYIEFLRLIGVTLKPPAAARVVLQFRRSQAMEHPLEIPGGTRVAVSRTDGGGEAPVFITSRAVEMASGESQVDVVAYHCERIDAELAGIGTSLPGLSVTVRRPPIVASTGDESDLIVAVEASPGELAERVPVMQHTGKVYRVWREVDSFTDLGPDRLAYMVDRIAGRITFAPAARLARKDGPELEDVPVALAAVPRAGREIRIWYRRGGGPAGNVGAGTLTVLKDTISGAEVTNPEPASGGQPAETLENALIRGPQELHSLHRAVTSRDFQLVAETSPSIARARALTQAALWTYATPGTVEVLLVPAVPEEERPDGRVTAAMMHEHRTETARTHIQHLLDERRPLGTACLVNWTHYKAVRVKARIVVHREADQAAIKDRVLERLHQAINPLPAPALNAAGWPFGQALRVSHVYDIALKEPGVRWLDRVRFLVEEVPEKNVASIASDAFQAHTWYAASESTLFRSLDNGEGWEPAAHFADEKIKLTRIHPERPGLLAAVTEPQDRKGARIHVSTDCGETWEDTTHTTAFAVNDAVWTTRDAAAVLLLATEAGLYELQVPGGSPVQVLVNPENQDQGFFAVAASRDVRGQVSVAVAAFGTGGVFLSGEGGRSRTFQFIGLKDKDIRVLEVQYDGPRSYLWAGAFWTGGWAAGGTSGDGCFRWELRGAEHPPEGWQNMNKGWDGGSCFSLAFLGAKIVAATHRAGVLYLDSGAREPAWHTADVRCGLPLRDPGRFHPVDTVAADPEDNLIMAGGVEGVYRSEDGGDNYTAASSPAFTDKVTLPPTWLFCSGEHDITIVSEDEAK